MNCEKRRLLKWKFSTESANRILIRVKQGQVTRKLVFLTNLRRLSNWQEMLKVNLVAEKYREEKVKTVAKFSLPMEVPEKEAVIARQP